MAEVLGILSGLYTTGQALEAFAKHTRKWRLLSDRLFDIREGLDAAELSLEAWQRKHDIQPRRHIVYMQVLFGRTGCDRIQSTLGSISIIAGTIRDDVNRVIGRALRTGSTRVSTDFDILANEQLVEDCLRRIRKSNSWSRKFVYSVLGRADDLEMRLERLHRKLTMLEHFSDLYLEKEHPEIFQTIKRLPGKRVILKVGDSRHETIQRKLLQALSARKDAELLHRASGHQDQIHIGISVPQILDRDFAFLLSLEGRTHEVLVHPVRIKAINDANRVQSDMATAIPSLIKNTKNPCYMLPSSSTSAGFQVSIPPSNILSDLEYKYPLSTLIRDRNDSLTQQMLYSQDQCALASGIAQGSFRLVGSRWLHFLDSRNIRWRRSGTGQWTSMMAAMPGDGSITRTLEQSRDGASQRRDRRDLSKHIQIFRIGLVLAELALKTPISYVDYDSATDTVKIYADGFDDTGEALGAEEIASAVEMRTNVLLGNMVFFCLAVLQDKDAMADKNIESAYFKDVLSQAEELDSLIRNGRKRASPAGSGIGTPRSGWSGYSH